MTDFYHRSAVVDLLTFLWIATKAWTISTAWKWRTWCLCMTCCWRCWMPTSCTVLVCLAAPPNRTLRIPKRVLWQVVLQIPGLHSSSDSTGDPQWSEVRCFARFRRLKKTLTWHSLQSAEVCELWMVNFKLWHSCALNLMNFSDHTDQLCHIHCLTTTCWMPEWDKRKSKSTLFLSGSTSTPINIHMIWAAYWRSHQINQYKMTSKHSL